MWKSTHPRKFGNYVTVHRASDRASDRPSAPQAYQCKKKTQSTGMGTQMQLKVLFGRKSHGRPDFKKKKSRVFFGVIYYVYTNVDKKERARANY